MLYRIRYALTLMREAKLGLIEALRYPLGDNPRDPVEDARAEISYMGE